MAGADAAVPRLYAASPNVVRASDGILRDAGVYDALLPALQRGDARTDDTDIWVTTYPKSGTQWLYDTATFIMCKGDEQKFAAVQRQPPVEVLAHFGVTAESRVATMNAATGHRLFQSHLQYQHLPPALRNGKGKIICGMRNPKDVAVSYFHFHRANANLGGIKDWLFSEFLPFYQSGEVYLGDFYEHVLGYWKHRDQDNMLIITYEDMRKDQIAGIRRMAQFLGQSLTDEEVMKIAENTGLAASRKRFDVANTRTGKPILDTKVSHFVRKGQIGDWKNHFTVAESEAYDQIYREKIEGSGLEFVFE